MVKAIEFEYDFWVYQSKSPRSMKKDGITINEKTRFTTTNSIPVVDLRKRAIYYLQKYHASVCKISIKKWYSKKFYADDDYYVYVWHKNRKFYTTKMIKLEYGTIYELHTTGELGNSIPFEIGEKYFNYQSNA